ncbi:hypothetical protein ZYGR_0AK01370 [Zygosaccharomyces rouxii]|uniref:Uncharacterized protein n=1 Tax=Zygosaccharomyces rouxii TaxID=4956 RepID=A0A1Q3ADD7_ZYGRO|nr:hypothetical protein ZYGR_0AK01370 [Zygosaccharomyces rouxii]
MNSGTVSQVCPRLRVLVKFRPLFSSNVCKNLLITTNEGKGKRKKNYNSVLYLILLLLTLLNHQKDLQNEYTITILLIILVLVIPLFYNVERSINLAILVHLLKSVCYYYYYYYKKIILEENVRTYISISVITPYEPPWAGRRGIRTRSKIGRGNHNG